MTVNEENAIADLVEESGERGFGNTGEMVCEAVKQALDKAGKKVTFLPTIDQEKHGGTDFRVVVLTFTCSDHNLWSYPEQRHAEKR